MDLDGEYINRFDTSINGVDLSKRLVSTNHNALGYCSVKSPDKYESGTWSVVHDYGGSTGWDSISWNSFEPVGTKVSVHVRSSNDQMNWSNWEDAGNGLSLKMTPPGRYLQVEVNLERFNNTESPVLYDISVNALNTSDEGTDLAVSITGNASSLGIGDTVHLIISLSNLGPKQCDAKLNYKIPVGLKLLSSQGPGVYDVASGVWDAGLLLVNDSVSLDLVLQAVNIGYFVNMVSVYGDLTSTHAHAAKPIVKVFNGKWKSTAAMSDSNGGNNVASYILDVRNHFGVGYQNFDYKWPDDVPPVPEPKPEPKPDPEPQPTPNPPEPPKPNPQPNSRLGQDILNVRESVSNQVSVDEELDYVSEFIKALYEYGSIGDDLIPMAVLTYFLKTIPGFFFDAIDETKPAAGGRSATEYLAAAILAIGGAITALGLALGLLFSVLLYILNIKSMIDKKLKENKKP